MKKTETGEKVMMYMQRMKDPAELIEISRSFNNHVEKLDETSQRIEKLNLELNRAHNERNQAEKAMIPFKKGGRHHATWCDNLRFNS